MCIIKTKHKGQGLKALAFMSSVNNLMWNTNLFSNLRNNQMTDNTLALIASLDSLVDRLQVSIGTKLDKTGIAAVASKLETARNIYIAGDGSATGSFDGTVAVTLNLVLKNSGVVAGSYPKVTVNSKGLVTEGLDLVASDIPLLNQNTSGNSATTSKLATARTQTISGDGTGSTTFDGSANTNTVLTLSDSGVVAGNYGSNSTYLQISTDSKGRVTNITAIPPRPATVNNSGVVQLTDNFNSNSTDTAATPNSVKHVYDLAMAAIPTSLKGSNNGVAELDSLGLIKSSQLPSNLYTLTDYVNFSSFPTIGTSGIMYLDGISSRIYRWLGNSYVEINPAVSSANSAKKLATARTISLSGDSTGSVLFDGDSDVNIAVTLPNVGILAGTYNNNSSVITPITVDAKGRVTNIGTGLAVTPAFSSVTGKPTTLSGYGITDSVTLSDTVPLINGVGSAGTGTKAARADHVHPTAGTAWTVMRTDFTAVAGGKYHLASNLTVTLPVGGAANSTIEFSKSTTASPLIVSSTPNTLSAKGVVDNIINYNADVTLLAVYNANVWEV